MFRRMVIKNSYQQGDCDDTLIVFLSWGVAPGSVVQGFQPKK